MRNFYPYLLLGALIITITSCSKEGSYEKPGGSTGNSSGNNGGTGGTGGNGGGGGGGNTGTSNGSEVGTWKYISTQETFSSTTEINTGAGIMKSVSTGSFTTTDNTGTVKFDGSTMTTTDIASTANTTVKVTTYMDGSLLNSMDMPYTQSYPASSSTANYTKIGTDSLYFPNGGLVSYDASGVVQSQAAGYKLKWDGDKMYLTFTFDQTYTDNSTGIPAKVTAHAVAVTTLQKM